MAAILEIENLQTQFFTSAGTVRAVDGITYSVNHGETVAIVVPDSFRTTRVEQVLPILVDGLIGAGILEGDIPFVYATGTHRGPTPEEERRILGDGIYERFDRQAFTHDPRDEENLVYVGTTSRGTAVHINRRVHEADRIIAQAAEGEAADEAVDEAADAGADAGDEE